MRPTRPPFLYPHGSVAMHSPLVLGDSNMYGFFLRGDIACLQASVDQTLNAGAGGQMRFKVITPYVMLTFTQVGHAHSARPVDQDKGWITETDIVTWVFVAKIDEENGQEKIIRFGDQHMKIRKNEPGRRKNFRARHSCDEKKSKLSAGYWSCKAW